MTGIRIATRTDLTVIDDVAHCVRAMGSADRLADVHSKEPRRLTDRYRGRVTRYAAVLWDLDGTIVDTEPLWMAAEHELAAEHNAIWTEEDGLALVGNSLIASGHYIRDKLGIEMSAKAVVDYLVERLAASLREHIDWRPGARELITALDAQSVPQALVTMSYKSIAEPVAASLPFAAVVTGDAVSRPKPYPDPYLLAAERLGVDAADCLAIEDSGTGAASANAAGCDVLVVPHFVNVPAAERRVQIATLQGLVPSALEGLFSG